MLHGWKKMFFATEELEPGKSIFWELVRDIESLDIGKLYDYQIGFLSNTYTTWKVDGATPM